MKTTVYRIQDSEGRGPFKPGMSIKWLDENRTFLPDAQISEQRWIKKIADPELHLAYVCTSIEQMKQWISKTEYARLVSLGYRFVKIEVDQIWQLDGQAIAGRKRQYRKQAEIIKLY